MEMLGSLLYDIDIAKTCCFSGNRNEKLPFNGDRNATGIKRLESTIELEIEELVKKGIRYFLTGMATGIDLMCAEAVYRLKAKYKDIELICVVPYAGHIREMKAADDKYRYTLISNTCYRLITLSEKYYKNCYKDRNEFMVNNAAQLFAVYDSSKKQGSGTYHTINYAKACGLDMKVIEINKNPQFYESF